MVGKAPTFLFSVDLEDARTMFPGGERFAERVPHNTTRILEFLAKHRVNCTFFTTGDVARRYPSLVRDIAARGHEVACHTSDHTPVDRLGKDGFRSDLERCRDDFLAIGVPVPVGFRAPCGSLVKRSDWAHEVLEDAGYMYSSSVVAAANPLYGWPEFGPDRPVLVGGLWELPLTLPGLFGLGIPFLGGVYFRVLPFPLVRALFERRVKEGIAATGYLHPFDVDHEQERYDYPELKGSRFYNRLMYLNRDRVFPRLSKLIEGGATIGTYREYVTTHLAGSDLPGFFGPVAIGEQRSADPRQPH